MTDYSAALIDARKQLDAAEKAAALHDWPNAMVYCAVAIGAALRMNKSLEELAQQEVWIRNAQRAM